MNLARDATEPRVAGGRGGRWGWRLGIDEVVLVYAAWTLGFWVALGLELGWAFALGFSAAVGGGLHLLVRSTDHEPTGRAQDPDDAGAIAVVLAVVLAWPRLDGLGGGALAVVAVTAVALRLLLPLASRTFGRAEVALVGIGGIAALSAAAFVASWTLMVVVLCATTAAVVVRAGLPDRWIPDGDGARLRRLPPALLLGAFGVLIGVWHIGVVWWSADNAYYLNKAAHYSESPSSFEVQDLMFGIDGAAHYPLGNILSSFEPLVGLLSALSGLSPTVLLFRLVAPLAMLAVPFAMRFAARGLGAPRPNLSAAFASAAIVLMTGTTTASLYATAAYGKTIGWLIGVPVLLGAGGRFARSRRPGDALRAGLAAVCVVGLSPSLGAAAALVVLPLTAAALWGRWTESRAGTAWSARDLWLALPLTFVAAYSLYARALQASAGEVQTTEGFLVLRRPELAWDVAFRAGLPPSRLTDLVLIGCVAALPLVVRGRDVRRAAGLLIVLVFGVVFAPWSFEPVVRDLLGLEFFADRLFWALPVVLLVGLALGGLDVRPRLDLLTALAAALLLGLSGPDLSTHPAGAVRDGTADVSQAPAQWPWEAGVPWYFQEAADAIADATPPGGRFLAPPVVEQVTTGTRIDVVPTYVREVYVLPVGQAERVPPGFDLDDRLLLESGMRPGSPELDAAEWGRALDELEVATVCTDRSTDDRLRQAIMAAFTSLGSAGVCDDVWSRTLGRS